MTSILLASTTHVRNYVRFNYSDSGTRIAVEPTCGDRAADCTIILNLLRVPFVIGFGDELSKLTTSACKLDFYE